MVTVAVPYHLDERLAAFDAGVPVDLEVVVELPAGDAWHRMSALYEQVAQVVASYSDRVPVVISGDCTTSLGVLAGLQRGGHEVGVVWFDAHADFHTEDTTTSGYLGGLPLALAAGVGTLRLPAALGLHPVARAGSSSSTRATPTRLSRSCSAVPRSGAPASGTSTRTSCPTARCMCTSMSMSATPRPYLTCSIPCLPAARRRSWWQRSSASSRRARSLPWVSRLPGTTTALPCPPTTTCCNAWCGLAPGEHRLQQSNHLVDQGSPFRHSDLARGRRRHSS